jgi:hypothetical protein
LKSEHFILTIRWSYLNYRSCRGKQRGCFFWVLFAVNPFTSGRVHDPVRRLA